MHQRLVHAQRREAAWVCRAPVPGSYRLVGCGQCDAQQPSSAADDSQQVAGGHVVAYPQVEWKSRRSRAEQRRSCPAYARRSCATCAAVSQQLQSSVPAGRRQSSVWCGVSTRTISATDWSTSRLSIGRMTKSLPELWRLAAPPITRSSARSRVHPRGHVRMFGSRQSPPTVRGWRRRGGHDDEPAHGHALTLAPRCSTPSSTIAKRS